MKNYTLFLLLLITPYFFAAGVEPTGTPREVSTLDHLLWISTNSTSWGDDFIQITNIDASFTSTWNPDGSGEYYGFSPIGNNTNKFTGTYNGQGFSITGLFINRSSTGYIGLFGFVEGSSASISNLDLEDVDLSGLGYIGAIVGQLNTSATISDCSSSGDIVSTASYVGGLVGRSQESNISNSNSTVDILLTGSGNYFGGLVGYNYSGTISNCYSSGGIDGNSTADYVGGFIGQSFGFSALISNCYSTGNITNVETVVGGFIGRNDGDIEECYSTGSLFSEGNGGGFVGVNASNTIKNCYSLGDITRYNNYTETSFGGFVGYNLSTIENCYSVGSVIYNLSTDPPDKGFVGTHNSGTYTSNFWDSDASNQTTALGAIAKTTHEMKTQATFENASWDFRGEATNGSVEIWALEPNATYNSGYPYSSSLYSGVTTPTGDGSSGTPYQIATLNDLMWITQNTSSWNKDFIQTENIDASSTSSWSGGAGFSPIGNVAIRFTGSYDGQNNLINNLFINRGSTNYVGLFGYVEGSGVCFDNLSMQNVNITGGSYSGGLAGLIHTSVTVTNCNSSGSVNALFDVGGLVGRAYNSDIISSYSSVNVGVLSGEASNFGGLVGDNSAGTISKSYSTGNVTGGGSNDKIGGLVGSNETSISEISNCYSSSNVSNVDAFGGGLIGYANGGDILNCYSIGNVDGVSDIGGLVGYATTVTTSNNFWDTQTSGQTSSAFGTGRATLVMKDYTSFTSAGWDFVSETANGSDDYWDADQDGTVNNGYVILAWQSGADNSLPVELTRFNAKQVGKSIVLNWQTATEINNYGFDVESKRASTGSTTASTDEWETIGFVEGHGNSNSPKEYSFIDTKPPVAERSRSYRLKQIDIDGAFEYSNIVEITIDGNVEYKLSQNHPNPFNPSTQISFTIPSAGVVKLNIYNVLGEVVSELVNENLEVGFHQYQFYASNLTSGIYFYSISVNGFTEVKKMNLIK